MGTRARRRHATGWASVAAAVLLVAGALAGPVAGPVAVAAAAAPGAAAAVDDEPVPVPLLTEPPLGLRGYALWDSFLDLEPFGYEDQELFVSGTADDGGGNVAPYTTRIIVTRPTDPDRFNGVVLLDWVNVTAQLEIAVDTLEARLMLMREGFAFVHVSAQQAGLCCVPGLTPKLWDPVRYAAIDHPGDQWSFEIFTQVAQAFRQPPAPGGVDPMGSLGVGRVEHVLAAGQSQSGIRLHGYLDRWLPIRPAAVGVIDGFLVHGDVGQPKTFAQPLPVPVIKLESDFEASGDGLDPDELDPQLRLWEVAGTAHSDLWIGYQSVFGDGPRAELGTPRMSLDQFNALVRTAGQYGEQLTPLHAACVVAGATMPMRYTTSAALHHLARWVDGGPPPNHGPRFEVAGGGLVRDADGNARGGIRLPPIDVPVASYASTTCALGGLTLPFTDLQLAQRYGSHAHYLELMAERTDAAVAAGWLLPEDAIDLMERACAARNRFPPSDAPCLPYEPPTFFQPLAGAEGEDAGRPAATDAPAAAGDDRAAPSAPAPPATVAGVGGTLPATGGSAAGLLPAALAAAGLAVAALARTTAARRRA